MKVRLVKDDINSNYKVSLDDISKEKDFIKILEDYNIKYKKTEYFKDFFMYKLLNINSKFIMILQERASNYIKYIEPVSIYSLPIQIDDINGEVPIIYPEENKNYITLGVLDNGIAHIKYLDPWIKKVHTRFLKKDTSTTHGTFVSGIALYGDKLENREMVKNEGFYLLDATVLSSTTIEEDELLQNIALAIKENYKKVKIWNLSLSVKIGIEEDTFSDFGVLLDHLQKTYGVLIFKSAGNGGNFMKRKPKGKLYHGSDSLLAIIVGAINNERYASNYSRVGLGPKGTIKPDLASYGGDLLLGDSGEMIMKGVKSFSRDGNLASSSGTSFATARVSSLATIIYQHICKDFKDFSDFNPILLKALIIHSAKNTDRNLSMEEVGYGIPATSAKILSYFKNENIKIFNGVMEKYQEIELNGSFFEYKKDIKVKITLVYDTEFDYLQSGEYIKSDIKIKDFSENGRNLTRKFEAKLARNKKIVLYSDSDIKKNFTLIVEKID
ncbi:S8 family peptidase [Fusobacterium simiae]|uniref:S8 family peptidase n=1 Tax=Fusobacterium simiae TaxID=855 RepID=A0ABT4DJY8_FUSSI|nr:S8 family peptidase [Fusobacterium simiae]MCY7008798.1 S8 family peptidase [Fusobacterium simiae]